MIADFKTIFDANVEILVNETDFTREQIMTSRMDECCDCRFVLIQSAREQKIPDCQIIAFSGFTRQQLQRATEQFEQRMKKLSVRILIKKVRKNIETLLFEML